MIVEHAYHSFVAYGRAEKNYARETLMKLRDCFIAWILPAFGGRELRNISRIDIISFRASMVDRAIGANRQYSVLMALKLFLKFCRNVLRAECLDPKEIELPRRVVPRVQFLTNDEVERLRDVPNPSTFLGLRTRTLLEVFLQTGLRLSEALSLNRAPFEQGQSEVEVLGKGQRVRTVFFPPTCLEWIRKFFYYRRQDDCPALFVTTGFPRRLARYDISKLFQRLRRDARIDKKLTPHMLRHTYCTNLLNNGADITFIKELAGHRDIQTTARYYLGVDKHALRNVVRRCLNYTPGAPAPDLTGTAGLVE